MDSYAQYSLIGPNTLAIPYTYATGCKWISENTPSRQLGE
jgi:hypothetical protein